MHKKFEVNQTKIKGGCQSYTKAAPQQSYSDLTLVRNTRFATKGIVVNHKTNKKFNDFK